MTAGGIHAGFACAAALLLVTVSAHAETLVWATHGTVKIRPQTLPADRATSVAIAAARNEYEPFQVSVRAPHEMVVKDIFVTDAKNPAGRTIDKKNFTVYRQHYYEVKNLSSVAGERGPWPDALIPTVDTYRHERRNALPHTVPGGFTQSFWVDLAVPADAAPGAYQAGIEVVTEEQGKERHYPLTLNLTVRNFALPATSSLPSSFGFDGSDLDTGHTGRDGVYSDRSLIELVRLYNRAGLRHRVAISGGAGVPAPMKLDGERVIIDWTQYDHEVGESLNGSDDTGGARWSATDVRWMSRVFRADYNPRFAAAYFKAWEDHFKERGWNTPLYAITFDEPRSAEDFRNSDLRARAMRAQAKDVAPMAITHFLDKLSLKDYGILCPLINKVHDTNGSNRLAQFQAAAHKNGAKLWWYQSCMSHDCEVVGNDDHLGWPSYMIDNQAIYHRVMPWLTWKYRIEGELYFNTITAYGRAPRNPWQEQFHFGGNGDGTLFYPGAPAKIGGKSDIPIETIRLKLIREGYEDYEYLLLAEKRAGRAKVDAALQGTINTTHQWSRKPEDLFALREKLASLIEAD